MPDKLKTLRERIITNFHGQGVPYDMYCNTRIVVESVWKQHKNYHPQVLLMSLNTLMWKTSNVTY